MGAEIIEPQIIERGPYLIVGAFAESKDGDEPWGEASEELDRRKGEIQGRVSDELIGFLYRPHRDNPAVPEHVRGCFMGVEVKDLDHVPEGMYTTRFSGGKFVLVACKAETDTAAAMAVGPAIGQLMEEWLPTNGYVMGDSCFTFSREKEPKPPFINYVQMKIEEGQR